MLFYRTYKIEFKRIHGFVDFGVYSQVRSDTLFCVINEFCTKNKITLKKLKIQDSYPNKCILKIKGTKEDYLKTYVFLSSGYLGKNIKIISAFKN